MNVLHWFEHINIIKLYRLEQITWLIKIPFAEKNEKGTIIHFQVDTVHDFTLQQLLQMTYNASGDFLKKNWIQTKEN